MTETARHAAPEVTTRELRDMGCGLTVGRYTLLRRLASGGMAEVYVARSRGVSGFEKKVAIKKILPQHSDNERFVDMLVDEAKITVSLTHPNIAQVYELGLEGEDYFIVMEHVDGRPLNRLMQRVDEKGLNTIPVDLSVHIMSEVAKGLDHAHKQKDPRGNPLSIVHRDVSPQNVLLAFQGDVKLIDFGIARAEGRLNQTSQGVIKGKLRYLAPEIAMGEEPDHRADVYCCGIVLFEMLTGEAMFAPKSDLEAIELATQAKVKSPRSRNSKVPQELDDIVMRALVRDRNHRYQSAKELHTDLRRFLNQHDPAFVGSELGDFMQSLFVGEIEADRELDALAERVAKRALTDDEEEETTLAAGPDSVAARLGEGKYKQLVTRLGIGGPEGALKLAGADGGRAMVVVPAGPSDRPPIHEADVDARVPGTMPPKMGPGSDVAATLDDGTPPGFPDPAEPTVRASNPFREGAPSVLPTITGPPPESPSRELAAAKPVAVWEGRESDVMVAPATSAVLPVASSTAIRIRTGPSWVAVLGGLALLALGGAAVLAFGGRSPSTPLPAEGKRADPITIDPISIADARLAPGTFILEVEPKDVRVSVAVDGRQRASQVSTPVRLDGIEPGVAHRILISADGYQEKETSRTLTPGQTLRLPMALESPRGTIRLRNVPRGATIKTSAGEVRRRKIVSIPLDTKVSIEVDAPGARTWRTEVHVTNTEPTIVEMPTPKALPKGKLVVNSRPVSTVFIDGKKKGRTPLTLSLAPGRYKILLKGPDGQKMTVSRVVNPGRTTQFTTAFR